jgi:hypothetical protein
MPARLTCRGSCRFDRSCERSRLRPWPDIPRIRPRYPLFHQRILSRESKIAPAVTKIGRTMAAEIIHSPLVSQRDAQRSSDRAGGCEAGRRTALRSGPFFSGPMKKASCSMSVRQAPALVPVCSIRSCHSSRRASQTPRPSPGSRLARRQCEPSSHASSGSARSAAAPRWASASAQVAPPLERR